MKKDKRKKSKNQTPKVCGACKPHKKKRRNDTKGRQTVKKEIEGEVE